MAEKRKQLGVDEVFLERLGLEIGAQGGTAKSVDACR